MVITETHTAVDTASSPIVQPQLSRNTSAFSGSGGRPLGGHDDIELMTMPSVVGRESGERDPLLLRDKIMSGEAISGIKQSVSEMRIGIHII